MMVVETSPPPGGPRAAATIPLDPAKLTQAYRRSTTISVPEVTAGRRSPPVHNMPPIAPLPFKMAAPDETGKWPHQVVARRDLQRLVREEAERGAQRPPTPVRPSLPHLEAPGVARGCRSRSEPRNCAREPPTTEQDFDQLTDFLDASVRSDGGGWRSIRARLSRDDGHAASSAGAARTTPPPVTLPPIGASGKQTPVQRMTRQETQRLLAAAKVNLQAMEAAKKPPAATQ